ncbi:MAG: response regulator, partial [Sedimenticola sp.]|nr:response regulator [Sedimenticola sp.]MCW8946334.1 response regulator [Sedimenticola sp.]MCW9021828.1 response regulator [Sedimenticola sp.]
MRILLIDDHALFRIGLQELLQRRGINVIGAFGNCEEGIALAASDKPDVVLLDMRMPDMTGIEVLHVLRGKGLTMPIAMLTTSREESDVINSLQGGAQGYLLKDMEPDELINALRAIVSGATIVAPELMGVLAKAVQGETQEPTTRDIFADLTPREGEILCLLADGQSNKVIARNLGISDG